MEGALLHAMIYLLIVGAIVAVVYWAVDAIPIPPPIGKVIKVVAMAFGLIIAILVLYRLAGVATPI